MVGTELVSVCDGQIVKNGDFTITYISIRPAVGLKTGMTVTKGSVLGNLGNGSGTRGPRLYLAISYKNVSLDPDIILNLRSRSSDSGDSAEGDATSD